MSYQTNVVTLPAWVAVHGDDKAPSLFKLLHLNIIELIIEMCK